MKKRNRLGIVVACLGLVGVSLAAPWTAQNAAWNVNVSTDGANPKNYYGQWPGHTYFPSPADWRSIAVYQFITDRFCDGAPSNNGEGGDLYKHNMRHGGDFKGVTARLDYIKSLGFQAVWISPIFINATNGTDYHGYAQLDFTVLDPRFGTLQDLRDLTTEAHKRGMYVIVDIVVNHMGNLLEFVGAPGPCVPFKFYTDEYQLKWKNSAVQYEDFKFNNSYFWGRYCPIHDSDGHLVNNHSWGNSYWLSDFHHNGSLAAENCPQGGSYGDSWACHLGKIYGTMDDLRTTHPNVQDKIMAMTKALIASTDIDGIRMDTPMQVPLEFFKKWCPAVKAHANTLGKNNFLIFGEFFCSRGRAANMIGRGRTPDQHGKPLTFIDSTYTMDGGINYPLYNEFFQPAVKGQINGKLNQCKVQIEADTKDVYDFYNPVVGESRYLMYNFFNNHDKWRMVHATDGFKKTDLAAGILAFWPGVPTYYYGDEQGFCSAGSALDGWAREDMMTSKAWYNVGTGQLGVSPNPAVQDNFDMCNPHYLHVQKCMNIRRQYPALRNTDELYERWCQSKAGNGIYAYTRVWSTDKKYWALVVFNTWSQALNAGGSLGDFWTGWGSGDVIVNAFNPSEKYTLGANGKLNSLSVGPYEVKVFVRNDNLQKLDPVVISVTPKHDERVSGSTANIGLTFSEDMDASSVMGAFRYDGQPVAANLLTYNASTRTLVYNNAPVQDGIRTVEVLETAKGAAAAGGKPLPGKFRSRFRKGSAVNPIAQTQYAPVHDGGLVWGGAYQPIYIFTTKGVDNTPPPAGSLWEWCSRTVKLHHHADGAGYYRVSNDKGQTWGPWGSYAATTDWKLGTGFGLKDVTVQYWADGSSAYFVTGAVELVELESTACAAILTGLLKDLLDTTRPDSAFTDPSGREEYEHALEFLHILRELALETETGAVYVELYERSSPELCAMLLEARDPEVLWTSYDLIRLAGRAMGDYLAGRGGENPFTPEDWARGRWLLSYFMENTRHEPLREDLAHLMEISFRAEGLSIEELLAAFIR
ncbi:MAG: hypothetical protein KA248_06190 [Kiritimatiellae bacterium]|nr:hypothetical protein [Kiritimatiellia bacterium]